MARDLTNQVIIITGASSGIGAATAIACADAGMDVVLNARRADKLQAVAQKIQSLGRKAQVVAGDITDSEINNRMLDAAQSQFNRVDAVFANAGYGLDRAVLDVSDEDLRGIFEVNFFAGADLLRKAACHMIKANRPGHLLMCSSCLAKMTMPYNALYCATKAAQNHFCRGLNHELREHGIYASSVHPIGTRTEFFETSAKLSGHPEYAQRVIQHTPGWMMQPPERVANAVVRCLKRPTPEVWTSFITRLGAGVMTTWPRVGDFFMDKAGKRMSSAD